MGDWYALKVRLLAGKTPRDYDFRTVRAIGTYPTFHEACSGAARACRAAERSKLPHKGERAA